MKELIGTWCFVVGKSGRTRWAVQIIDVNPGGFVKVSANSGGGNFPKRAFGNDRWVQTRDLYTRKGTPLCAEKEG